MRLAAEILFALLAIAVLLAVDIWFLARNYPSVARKVQRSAVWLGSTFPSFGRWLERRRSPGEEG